MDPIDDGFDLTAETTEQALARVEAECGWSDVRRFPDAWAPAKAAAVASVERNEG